MKAKLLFFVLALVYTLAIAYLSLINLAQTPVSEFGLSDKIMHAGAYFGMALLWLIFGVFAFGDEENIKKTVFICTITIVFGIFIEVLQNVLTDYRELDFYDIVANSIGVLIAGVLAWRLNEYLIRLKAKINLFLLKK